MAVVIAYPGGILAAYGDLRDYGAHRQTLDDEAAAFERHSAKAEAINARIQIKDMLIEELVAGRTSLVEVASRFRVLNQDVKECEIVMKARYPGVPEEERAARNVIDFVRVRDMSPCDKAEVLHRLQSEFEATYGPQYAPSI